MKSPKTWLKALNIEPKKELGQHFLIDPAIAERIVELSGIGVDDVVLEIGSGLGSLTFPAAARGGHLFAVEKDLRIAGLLKTALTAKGVSNVVVVEKDILKIDIGEFAGTQENRKIIVLGNLPYNISSPVLIMLVNFRRFISRCVLMFQKELAQRIVSFPGSRDYGRLSVVAQYCADVKAVLEVPSSAFYPKVKVDSTVLEIKFNEKNLLPGADEEKLFKVVKAAFGKRRKTLKNALSGSELKIPADRALSALLQAGIDPIRRAETLSVDEFIKLSGTI